MVVTEVSMLSVLLVYIKLCVEIITPSLKPLKYAYALTKDYG